MHSSSARGWRPRHREPGALSGAAVARVSPSLIAVLVGGILFGVAARILVYRSTLGRLDADEAVWGLMARHAVHGQFTAFYWGQPYGGTQEVLLVALLFAIAGTHLVLMRLVPIALTAVAAFLVWRIGRRTIGEPAARVAAVLMWVWPPYTIWKLDHLHGFYGSGLVYTCLILLLVLRLDERRSKLDTAVLGLVLGLVFWQTNQIVVVVVPALLWLTFRRPSVWADSWIAVPGVVVGALPWLLSNLHHQWWSLRIVGGSSPYVTRLHGFFSATFPLELGLRVPFSERWILGTALTGAIYFAALVAFAVVTVRTRHQTLSLLTAFLAAYPFLYASSPMTWFTNEPRYVVLAAPALALLLARGANNALRAGLLIGAAAVVSVVVLTRWAAWERANASHAFDQVVDVRPAIAALQARGVHHVFADYWIAGRITFDTRERVIAANADLRHLSAVGPHRVMPPKPRDYRDTRYPAYDRAIRSAKRHAYLLLDVAGTTPGDTRFLVRHGYSRTDVGHFVLLVSPPQAS